MSTPPDPPRRGRRSPVVALGAGAIALFLVTSYLGWTLVRAGTYRLSPWAHLLATLALAVIAVLDARRLASLDVVPWPRRVSAWIGATVGLAATFVLWGFVFVGSRLPEEHVTVPRVAPGAVLLDDAGEPVRLERRWVDAPVVLAFFRGGFDGWSRAALSDLERLRPAVEAAGGHVIAVGADSGPDLRGVRRRLGLGPGLVMLSDPDLSAARAFGLVGEDPRALRPATFVVAPGGALVWAHVPASARELPAAADLLAALRALPGG